MEAIALVAGIACKVYDDIVDTDIKVSDVMKESLKGLQWMFLAILSVNDFNFTLLMLLSNIVHYLSNKEAYSLPYERSLLYVYPILLLLSFHTREYLNIYSIFIIIYIILWCCIEPRTILENESYKKIINRFVCVLFPTFIALYNSSYISSSIIKYIYYCIGYVVISILFQLYMLYYKPEALEPLEPEPVKPEPVKPIKPEPLEPNPLSPLSVSGIE